MLDPATRLLRQAIFSTWSRFAADQKETRARVIKRGYWRQDQTRKRLIFDALVAHTRRALKEKVVDLKRRIAASTFTKFEQKYRENAASVLELLIKHVELEQNDTDAASSNETVCTILNHAVEMIVGAENYPAFRLNVASDKSHVEKLAALFKLNQSPQLEPKPVVSIQTNNDAGADVRDASTSYETPRVAQITEQVSEIAIISEATPYLSFEVALEHIANIYEVAVARAGALNEIARDYFNRVYEIRTSVCHSRAPSIYLPLFQVCQQDVAELVECMSGKHPSSTQIVLQVVDSIGGAFSCVSSISQDSIKAHSFTVHVVRPYDC